MLSYIPAEKSSEDTSDQFLMHTFSKIIVQGGREKQNFVLAK